LGKLCQQKSGNPGSDVIFSPVADPFKTSSLGLSLSTGASGPWGAGGISSCLWISERMTAGSELGQILQNQFRQ
jgi:hypothetical protein